MTDTDAKPRHRRVDYTGKILGAAEIGKMEGEWIGQRKTYYAVDWQCCGRRDRKSHYQISAWVESPPQKCQWCRLKKSENAPPAVRDPVRANTVEIHGLERIRKRARDEMMTRVRAKRAQAEAAAAAAHRRAMGMD